jgi:hypothetical protein
LAVEAVEALEVGAVWVVVLVEALAVEVVEALELAAVQVVA